MLSRARNACRRLGPLAVTLVLAAVLAGALAVPATADVSPASYPATPPTRGALYHDGPDGRYLLGGTWLYQADPQDVGLSSGWWRDNPSTLGWSTVSVPNAFNAGDLSGPSMYGSVGWYRRDFVLPARAFSHWVKRRDRKWIVRFESVNYRATVWLNGRQIGFHAGAFLPFEFDLSNLHPGVNRLIVRVDDRRGSGDLPPGPGGGWWNFGGITREVYLRRVQRVDISQAIVRPVLSCPSCAATVEDQVTVRNLTGRTQPVILTGYYGHNQLSFGSARIAPHASWVAQASVVLKHPHLWSPAHPTLYRATVNALDPQGHRMAHYFTDSGVRKIAVTPDGRLTLNGHLLDLRGVNFHEQVYAQGSVMTPNEIATTFGWVRDLGATILRAHYPLNPEFQELADRYGLLIWSEVPVYQSNSQYYNQPNWLANAHAFLQQNILTNQNHPSVLLWSIGNELQTPPPPSEASYIAGASALAHKLDPTRPVTMAIADWPGVSCQSAYSPLDVLGFNEYFGWFDAGGGTTDDRDQLSPFLDSLRACYPHQAIMVSEFGFEGNRHGPVEERGTYEFQANTMAFHLGVFASKPWLSGAIWFAMQTFAARPGWTGGDPRGNPPYVEKGMLDQFGNRTPNYGVMQSLYRGTQQILSAKDTRTRKRSRTRRRARVRRPAL